MIRALSLAVCCLLTIHKPSSAPFRACLRASVFVESIESKRKKVKFIEVRQAVSLSKRQTDVWSYRLSAESNDHRQSRQSLTSPALTGLFSIYRLIL